MLFDRFRLEEDLERIRRANLESTTTESDMDSVTTPDCELDSDKDTATPENKQLCVPDELPSVANSNQDSALNDYVADDDVRVGAKDILAMIIAVFSLILPGLLIMLAAMGLVLLWWFRTVIF